MSEFVLVTDSSADLSEEMVQAIRVPVLPLRFTIQRSEEHTSELQSQR